MILVRRFLINQAGANYKHKADLTHYKKSDIIKKYTYSTNEHIISHG